MNSQGTPAGDKYDSLLAGVQSHRRGDGSKDRVEGAVKEKKLKHKKENNMNIRYGRVFNLGNYETERIEVEDEVREGESMEDAIRRLRKKVIDEARCLHDDV